MASVTFKQLVRVAAASTILLFLNFSPTANAGSPAVPKFASQWGYGYYLTCYAWQPPNGSPAFKSEDEAINHHVNYLKASSGGCPVTGTNDGTWPTPTSPATWPCDGTSQYPRLAAGIEESNFKPYMIEASYRQSDGSCSAPTTTTYNMARSRQILCPDGYVESASQCILWDSATNPHKASDCKGRPNNAGRDVTANPIACDYGNKMYVEVDYSGTGPYPVVIGRKYNSKAAQKWYGVSGPGWSFQHERFIAVVETSSLTTAMVSRGTGQAYFFTLVNGVWQPDSDVKDRLEKTIDGWRYIENDGSVDLFDNLSDPVATGNSSGYIVSRGKLLASTNPAGLMHTYSYNAAGTLDAITDPTGQRITFNYSGGRIAGFTAPDGSAYSYSYDAIGNLQSVNYPDTTSKTYHYENTAFPSHLTGITNPGGQRYSTYAYDTAGRAISSELANGLEKVSILYQFQYYWGMYPTVTDAAGISETKTFYASLGVSRLLSNVNNTDNKTFSQTFDVNGNLTCRLNEEGRLTTYTYNATNQKVSMTEGQGGSCGAPTTTPATQTTTYQYLSPTLDLPTVIESPSVAGGTNKKRTTITYTGNLPTTITQTGFTPAGAAVSRSVTLGYNANGQITSIDGPRLDVNDITAITYYECNTGGACGQVKSVTNAATHTTTYDSYDAAGRLLQMTDANGLKTTYTYDTRGRVATVTLTAPDTTTRVTSYTYDAPGNLAQVILPDGRTLTYAYNAANYLTSVTDNAGNRIEYGYDLKGNRTSEKTFDASNTLARSIDSAFDIRNRPSELNRGGSITKQVWDAIGNLLSSQDPNTVAAAGATATTHQYDALNRLTTTIDRLSGNTGYSYDANNRVARVAAPNGAVTQYSYDDLGNLLQETSADRGTTTYTVDTAGNVRTMTDARGVVATYSYDVLNRLTAVTYSASPAETVAYTYDTATGCTFGAGRLCAVTDAAGTGGYAYNAFGNLLTQTRTELGVTYATRFTYDAANRVTSITYPDNRVLTYTRDNLGRVTSATTTLNGASQSLVTSRSYRPDGLLTAQTFGNGLSESRIHDLQGRLTQQSLGSADNRLYSYDANSNLTSLQTVKQASAYLYDALDRLTLDQYATSTLAFNYDPNSNRLGDGIGTYNYLANSNRLTTSPSGAITLDAAGNTLTDGLRTYTYNAAGHLASVTQGATTASYSYNHQRLRTRKSSGGVTTVYHYTPDGTLLMESSSTGAMLRSYFTVDNEPLALIQTSAGAAPEVIHDNTQAVFTGTWATRTSIAGFYGTNYQTNAKGGGKDKATWTIPIPANGSYQVYARWVAASTHASNAPYTITHSAGSTTVTQSQRTSGGQWVLLGTYNFTTTAPAKITLSDKVNGTGTVIADAVRLVATTAGPSVETIHYLHTDHLSTPRLLTDSTQKTLWRWDGNAFGDTAPNDDADGDGKPMTMNLRFPGQYFDAETGLHYNWNRYYDPKTGRYVTSDPIGLKGGLNTYLYASANPLRFIDPKGLQWGGDPFLDEADISPPPPPPYDNGNYRSGFNDQDWKCSSLASPFNFDKCSKQCCVEHDACYKKYGCNDSSWRGNFAANYGNPCQICNINVMRCIRRNIGKANCGLAQCSPQ